MTIKPTGGFDLSAFKSDVHALANAPITMKELQGRALAGIRRAVQQVRMFGQGTPAHKRKHVGGRKRLRLADGRMMHPTKGIGKSDRGGYAKRSRRSNTSRS